MTIEYRCLKWLVLNKQNIETGEYNLVFRQNELFCCTNFVQDERRLVNF